MLNTATKPIITTPRVDLLDRMLRVMSPQQWAMLIEDLETACEISEIRHCPATVTIIFKNGHPAFLNITLGRRLPPPAG